MADHLVDLVNEKDEVLGQDLKSQKKIKNFISRTVGIFIRNSDGKFLICKRGAHKKNDPNVYDVSAYGNVMAGETYEDAAKRELFEETGITCDLVFLEKYYREVESNGQKHSKNFCAIFFGESDQEPKLNEELSGYKMMNFNDLERAATGESRDYCQGLKDDFNKVREKLLEHITQ